MITVNGKQVIFGRFPNGEIYLERLTEQDPNTVVWRFRDNAEFFELLLVNENLHKPSNLHITYFPYSRMDRRSDEYAFSLQTVANLINWMEWESVTVYEPHSDVTPAILNLCYIKNVIPRMMDFISKPPNYQVFYPDAGAQKRYADLIKSDNELVGFKKRDFKTGRILDLQIVGERKADTVYIVDDLCSKGGTFVLAAEHLRLLGFQKIILVVAHCENTIHEGKVFSSGLIDHVFTTDSLLTEYPLAYNNLTVYPLLDLMQQA